MISFLPNLPHLITGGTFGINPGMWILALLPILVFFVALIVVRFSAPLAAIIALIAAGISSYLFFGGSGFLLLIASAKGLSLSLFVLLIVWSALFFYNLMQRLGTMDAIADSISRFSKNRLGQALLFSWAFSGFIEGIAGFGVPVAVLAPLMLALGFPPLTAAAAVLVGHSWAVTFGAMGSAYYSIQLITGISGDTLGPTMAALFALPIFATGFCVAHIVGGWRSLRKGAPAILIVGFLMSVCVWLATVFGAAQIASIIAGLVGCAAIWMISKTAILKDDLDRYSPPEGHSTFNRLSFHMAFMPYYILIFLTLLSQVPFIKQVTDHLSLSFHYPGLETSLGYTVVPVKEYAKIRLIGHPAPLILVSAIMTALVFRCTGRWKSGAIADAIKSTVHQCTHASLGIVIMLVMALIMNDTGMTMILALGFAKATGVLFPIFSPNIGVLGCFMTGSNTNSNVMFGALQQNTANFLGISTTVIASVQSIGGSLGSSIAPAKLMIGSGLVGLGGRESTLMRKTLAYCLIVVFLVGLEAWIATQIYPHLILLPN